MPLLDRVLVQRIKAETKTAGGIFLPESSVKELNEATVLAVGPGGFNKSGQRLEMSVKAGDKVLIPQVRAMQHSAIAMTTNDITVRWQPCQGRRGGVPALQGSRVRRKQGLFSLQAY